MSIPMLKTEIISVTTSGDIVAVRAMQFAGKQ
jgi:hypothetical protein